MKKINYSEYELNQIYTITQKLKVAYDINLPKQYKILLNELSLSGWYMDYGLSLKTISYLLSIDYQNKTILDSYLMAYYRQRIKSIEKFTLKSFPARSHIIKSAFYAHKKKLYELSIPVILTQIDGISFDLYEFNIFSKKETKKNKIPKNWIEKLKKDNLTISILEPLMKNDIIAANFIESKQYNHVVNRNQILHGRIIDYNSEKNSLKVISLLNYLITIVKDIGRNDDQKNWF